MGSGMSRQVNRAGAEGETLAFQTLKGLKDVLDGVAARMGFHATLFGHMMLILFSKL